LTKLARVLKLEKRVSFSESLPRKELLQKYVNADLFALLSRHEAYGISVAEALASRTPCIVANASALQEWVDNKNCFGLNYPIELDALADLINHRIGKKVDEVYLTDWNENVEKLSRLYLSC
jgi:glycosyltransferase involved in cell wall biosynthesis